MATFTKTVAGIFKAIIRRRNNIIAPQTFKLKKPGLWMLWASLSGPRCD